MDRALLTAAALLLLAGCGNPKVDNPVVGPPPPRVRVAQSDQVSEPQLANPLVTANATEPAGVVHLALGQSPEEDTNLAGSQTVALVNGSPLLASEVLEPYATQLAQMEEQIAKNEAKLSLAQKQQARQQLQEARQFLLKRDLKGHIERKLLIGALRETLKPEQIKMLEGLIESEFEKELADMMKKEGVNTRLELEKRLQEQNTSVAGLRDLFFGERLAMEYMGYQARARVEIGRPDLVDYYEEHLSEYAVPAKVKWQQLLVSFRMHGGRDGAQAVLKKAARELSSGADFGDVVRKYSNGLNSETGGHIGWTEPGSFADKALERVLFEQPVGVISKPLENQDSFQIVKVTDRQPAGRVPLTEVQDEIREKVQKQRRQELARKLIDDLRASAVVVTVFDDETRAAAATNQ